MESEVTFTLEDLIQPVTRAEAQQSIYDVLGVIGVNTTGWKSGSVVRTMIVAASAVLAALSDLQAKIARSGFLDYSEKQWLTLVARYVYGVERIMATFATGEVTLSNSGGGVYAFEPDDLIFANSATGKQYRNLDPVSIPALSSGIPCAIRAVELGADSSAAVGEVDSLVTVVLGVECSNVAALVGTDDEEDGALRARCKQKLGALSPFGPWDAYAYAVRSATREDGTSIGVTRLRIVKDGYGTVTTYVAGANGAIPGDAEDPATDLGIANEAIQRKAAPLSVNAVVLSAVNRAIAVTYEAWVYDTTALTDAELEAALRDAVSDFLRAQPIGGNVIAPAGGKVFASAIQAAIYDALPEVFRVVVTVPSADVDLAPDEVPFEGVITPTAIHLEPPPEGFGGDL